MSDRYKRKIFKVDKTLPHIPDKEIAEFYLRKFQSCVDRNISFCLSLQSFINICRAKKCYYTGLPLTIKTLTIDRIDSTKGYEKGNVVACHKSFNVFKGIMENPDNILDYKLGFRGMNKLMKRLEG